MEKFFRASPGDGLGAAHIAHSTAGRGARGVHPLVPIGARQICINRAWSLARLAISLRLQSACPVGLGGLRGYFLPGNENDLPVQAMAGPVFSP